MSNQLNQANKEAVWDLWQRLNHATDEQSPGLLRAALHEDVNWNVSAPIDQLIGVESVIADFWLPLRQAFPDLKRAPYVFMGGTDEGASHYASDAGQEWVSGTGYLTGSFVNDWLGIPATGRKTNIWFGVFYVMRAGKIAEAYLQLDILAVIRQAGFQLMPPAPGAEGGKIPGPLAKDGILLTEQDALESRKTAQLVSAMGAGMRRYQRARDGGDLRSMEQNKYWHPDMKWYGPSGIGACHTLEEYEDYHQRNWLHGFGDRDLMDAASGRRMGWIGEGAYCCGGIWDGAFSYNHGDYAGIPATGKLMTMRDFDWWKREGELLIENWVPIDMIDLLRQLDINLMARLQQQILARKRGDAGLW